MITAIVPIKQDSERLEGKNFLSFCGQPIYQVVLDKLQKMPEIVRIVINTDSGLIRSDCSERYSKALIIDRPHHLQGHHVTMNSIIAFDLSIAEGEHFLQTHVTNPLLTEATIRRAIESYFDRLEVYDSLLSVEHVRKRVYDRDGHPINHSNQKLEPTQNLPGINIENSNLFLFSRTSFFENHESRIGAKPQLFPMSPIEGIDIDYREDFLLAELIAKNKDVFFPEQK